MDVSTEQLGDTLVVRMSGSLNSNTAGVAAEALDALIANGAPHLLISLRDVDFVSSAGLRVLLAVAKRLNAPGHSLRVSDLNRAVSDVFDISGFRSILRVFETESDALGSSGC